MPETSASHVWPSSPPVYERSGVGEAASNTRAQQRITDRTLSAPPASLVQMVSQVSQALPVTTADVAPPLWGDGSPRSLNHRADATEATFDVAAVLDEPGTVYYVVLPETADASTHADPTTTASYVLPIAPHATVCLCRCVASTSER